MFTKSFAAERWQFSGKSRATSRWVVTAAMVVLAIPLGSIAQQKAYPSRPVTLMVGYAAGGSTDYTARVIAPELSKRLGQPVAVENLGGAGGTIAAAKVATSTPDGHMLYLCTYNEIVGAAAIRKSLPYDPLKDIVPIGMIGTQAGLLLTTPRTGVRTPEQFVSAVRRAPGKFTYGSPGLGSALNLSMEMAKSSAGLFMVHIPYRGVPPMVNDLLGENLDYGIFAIASGLPFVKSGKLVAIGTTERTRTPATPDIPALSEHSALREVNLASWFALCGPGKLAPEIRSRLKAALEEILSQPDVRSKLVESGTTVQPQLDMEAFIRKDLERTRLIVKYANIKDE